MLGVCYPGKTKVTDLKKGEAVEVMCHMKRPLCTFRSQVVFRRRLLGLRSLCSTLAEWMYLRPLRIW